MEMFARARPAAPTIRRAFFTLSLLALPLVALPQTKPGVPPKHIAVQTVFPKDTSQFLVRFNVKLAKKSYANHAKEEGKKPAELVFFGMFEVNIPQGVKKAIKIKNGLVLDAATQDSLLARGCHESNNHVFIYQTGGKLYVFEKK